MLRYSEISEPTRPGEGDWVDFPASPEPDPWAALLREASRLSPDVSGAGTQRAAGATHQIAPFPRSLAHRRVEPETMTAKNG
jgi:hypothetical protein